MAKATKPQCYICMEYGEEAQAHAHGLCNGHNKRWLKGARGSELKQPLKKSSPQNEASFTRIMDKSFEGSLEGAIYQRLLKSKRECTVEILSDEFNVGVSRIRAAIEELKKQGKQIGSFSDSTDDVKLLRQIPPTPSSSIDIAKLKGRKMLFGVLADQHLCSRYARLDVLNALYDIYADQGISTVYQLGNIIDGEARFNQFDLLTSPGMESQIAYLIENWPQRKGIVTEFITGDDHEGWYVQKFGVDIGRVIQERAEAAGRFDLKYIGHMEHDIELKGKTGSSFMRLVHPGGGSAYALSYSVQKTIESYQGGEKPAIVLFGHWHKFEVSYPREVWCVQCGSTEDQTPFLRKLKIQSHLGGCTISFEVADDGTVHSFMPQFHAFYDRGFYEKGWKYRFPFAKNQQAA